MSKANIFLLVIVLVLGSCYLYDVLNRPRTGFIVIGEVFSEFSMKKDLEKKFNATKNARQKILDSLAVDLRILAKKIDGDKAKNKEDVDTYNAGRENFYRKQKEFEADNGALTRQYDQEILTQLNQYVRDYGKEKNYQYIFGNDNNGSLMYAHDSKNLTREIIDYINKKYQGK